jgi:hypothetical protein
MADPLRLAAAAIEFGMARYGRGEPQSPLILRVASVVCASGAGGFAVAALLIYLIPLAGTSGATLIVACVLMAISLIAAGVSAYLIRPARKQNLAKRSDLESLLVDAEGFVRENKGLVLAAAFIAGLLADDEGMPLRRRPKSETK